MSEYTGKNLHLLFVHPAGTATLNTDYRTFSSAPVIGLVDASAGSDADKTYLTTTKDGKYSYGGLHQVGGTVLEDALLEGTHGTLLISPEGTASGKRLETVPVIAMGAQINMQYENVVEITCEFQKNGARVLSVH